MTILVIVESPAKCKKIETYLGPGYKCIASFGHFRSISGLGDIDINNHFSIKYSVTQEKLKLKQIEKMRTEIENASEVILATDDDREGESIAWHICDLFGLSVENTKRILFHEITETAILHAIKHPQKINMQLVDAQKARQVLDLLVGFTVSPILWKCLSKNHDNSLSAGRCQTPALRLVYENHIEIKNSPGTLLYNTTGYFTNMNLLFDLNKHFQNKEDAMIFLELCKSTKQFQCSISEPKSTLKRPPEPLTTSSLQQLASNELNMSPKETMRCAQQLYEAGYITYMRTDSKKYSIEFVDNVKTFISSSYGDNYINAAIYNLCDGEANKTEEKEKKTKSKTKEKETKIIQEAHEAIRPVKISVKNVGENDITSKAVKLYNLIWKRTLESCMPSAQYKCITAKIIAPLDSEFVRKAEQVIFPGWHIVEDKYEKQSKEFAYFSTMKQDISLEYKKIECKFTMHDLKTHYSEARLVQLLEEKGIGRPSTFASLIDKIQERGYVEKQNIKGKEIEEFDFSLSNEGEIAQVSVKKEIGAEKNKLVIQPLGIIVIEYLIENFGQFFNYDYTKQMEDKLDSIAKGKETYDTLCSETNAHLNDTTKGLADEKFSIKIDDNHSLIIGKYGPVVKKQLDVIDKKKVEFLKVKKDIDMTKLSKMDHISLDDVLDKEEETTKNSIGKYNGEDLYIKKGKFGTYIQWGNNRRSLKEVGNRPIENITYMEVLQILEKDNTLDPSKPIGLVRELGPNLSIRCGKFGDYIYYKRPRAKKPDFLKLKGFNDNYRTCNKDLLINWIQQTYNI